MLTADQKKSSRPRSAPLLRVEPNPCRRQREEIGWNVLHEELLEVTEAYAVHNYEHALQELAQCGAVILRMMEFVQKEKKEGE